MYSKQKKNKKSSYSEEIINQEEDTTFGVPKKQKARPPKPQAEPPQPRKKKLDADGNAIKEEKKETKAQRVKDVEVTVNEDEIVEVDMSR